MQNVESVRFETPQGNELAGRLHRPLGRPRGWALFAHCFTCGKDLRTSRRVTEALAAQGIGTLRFDFTGLGESDGGFAESDFSANVGDIVAAASWMKSEGRPIDLLVGHSLGGAGVLRAATQIDSVRAVATIGAPSDPGHVVTTFADAVETIERTGEAQVDLGGRPFCVSKQFIDDLREHPLVDELGSSKTPLLILHAPLDEVVSIDHARRLFEAARHPKSFIAINGADHLLSDPADVEYVGTMIAAWAMGFLDPLPDPAPGHRDDVEVVTGEGFGTDVVVNDRHRLRADEPASVGGADTGPTPYDFLATALGACTSMTLRMYADRKEWPLESVRVHVRHDRIHAKDCEDCESTTGHIDRFQRSIELTGSLEDGQRQQLLGIADRCPVHRTLHSEVSVLTELADP